MSVVDVIRHYQRSIEKCQEDEERMLHCINKLCRLPITVQLLKETGVGRTVNALRKFEGQVGEAAKYTVMKWKQMVAEEESSDDDGEEAGDETGTEMHTEETDEPNAIDEEEEDGDSEGDNVAVKENSKHSHKDTHNKSRKDDNHKTDTDRHEHKSSKEKTLKDVTSIAKKHKDSHNTQDSNNRRDKHSHKRKRESSKNHRRDEKRKKYESENENLSEDDSESQEMLIDERVTEAVNAERYTDEEQEEAEDDDDSNGVNDCDSRLLAPDHGSHSKHHSSSSSSSHHNKHHKESHRKHNKHKEKKVHSSDKHSRKSDSDKVNERMGDNKEKHSKHKDHKHEHKNNKHKDSNSTGELRKLKSENVKQNADSVLKDSNSSKTVSKTKAKEKTESASKTNTSHKHHKPDTKPKEVKEKKIKKSEQDVDEDDDVGGISSMSGASFAEALGMVDPMIKKKSTNSSGPSTHSKAARSSSSKTSAVVEKSSSKSKEMKPPKVISSTKDEPAPLLSSSVKLEPLKVDLDATLPEISPNYRPLPHPALDAMPHKKIKVLSDEEALAQIMSQKNQRTKVYSGMKSGKSWSSVPTLFDICVRVLQENIEAIEYTGGVPYDLLKPVLNIATPDQLFTLEHYNPYLIEDTDELWEFHCKKSFRTKEREEMETWRDMYMRCVEEREAKLKALTSNIQQSIAKSTPVRQTKLAYVDSIAKPPRNVAKQQAKYGTAGPVVISKGSPSKGPKAGGIGGHSSAPSTSAAPVPVPPPRGVQSVTKVKPRMAPLMQKTMKLVKSFKR